MAENEMDHTGEPNVTEDAPTLLPPIGVGVTIPHYYGDYVRQIFMAIAAALLILAPFLLNRAPALLPIEIGGAIALVCLAALTNPHNSWVLMADAIAAGIGVVLFEALAIAAYSASSWLILVAMEAVTVAFLAALYFSMKTLRAMLENRIGKQTRFGEFTE